MTTVATDGNAMAADGRVTSGNVIFGGKAKKLFRLPDGRLVGIAGSIYNFGPFIEWLGNGGDKPALEDGFEALVLSPKGKCHSYDDKCRAALEELPTAIGSGREIAIGAMEAGASPVRAVKIASKRDTATGGRISVMERAV